MLYILVIYIMSIPTDIKFNESPHHFMVLDAVSRGINSLDKITKVTKLQKDEVELVINDLLMQRLIVKIEKKGFIFGKKRIETGITQIGIKLLNAKKKELEQQKQKSSTLTTMAMALGCKAIWNPIECGYQ
jgi:hypothetical protein